MNAKTTIRRLLFITVWLCIGGGMLTLLLAAISKKNKEHCRDYTITIKGAKNNLFIDKKDVEQLLMKATNGSIKGELVSSFRLHELEQALEYNTWIDEAELYFDNKDVLHITVMEKEPVARIFTTTGNSFYIDSAGQKMPLSDKLSARVPVFTGFPEKKKLNTADSALLNDVREMANYIINNSFWMSQVSQIDITAERNFEMVPVVGNHLVKLGNGENMDSKFDRLMIFYKQVLSKTGFGKYKVIDVQYKGQVVASRYAGDAKIDSVQLRKNVEKLLLQSMEAESDTAIRVMKPLVRLEADSASAPDLSLKDNGSVNEEQQNISPAAVKPVLKNEPKWSVRNNQPKPIVKKQGPKAVMPKKPAAGENEGYD
jgi:cell division protein FtsQ